MQIFQPVNKTYSTQNKPDTASYRKKFLALVVIICLIKLILSFALELGNDEAYYWLYAQYWQWNYFDHPPMVAIWIRLFTANLLLQQYEGFVRLGSVLGGVLASWFLFRAVSLLHSERAGWYTALLYNISFYSGITAGLYILPDSPQMVFWTLALLLLVRITKDEHNWRHWLAFGLVSGLCIMSKIHGAFLWVGLGMYILFLKTAWLKKPQVYVAFFITAIIISPIFFWNIKYDFATFRFHGNRVDIDQFILQWRYFFKELASQVGFNNPVNFFLIVSAFIAFWRNRIQYHPALIIFIFTGLPLAILLLSISLFRNVTLPHWSGPAYVSLMPLAAVWLASNSKNPFPRILQWGLGSFLFVFIGYSIVVKCFPGTYGSHKVEEYGRGDLTLDMYGWQEAATKFDSLYKDDVVKNIMPANAAIVTSHWWGAHVEYYFARPLSLKMIGIGNPRNLNEYLWTNKWRKAETDLNNAYFIVPVDDKYTLPRDYYQWKEQALVIDINRNKELAHRFLVYRLKELRKQVPVISK